MGKENNGAYIVKTGLVVTLGTIENVQQQKRMFIGPLKAVAFEKGFEY